MIQNCEIIRDVESCDRVCAELNSEPILAIDTEFFTKKNIFVLSIVQIASHDKNFVFDLDFPIGIMPESLKKIFSNKNIVKVFHAYQQDVEILRRDFGIRIENVFDTQIAMMFLSSNAVYSYQDLVKEFLNVTLEKLHKNDDWQVRPLTESQINYAVEDVFYLFKLYPLIVEKLEKRGRLKWMNEYMIDAVLHDTENKIDEVIKKFNIAINSKEQYYRFCKLFELLNDVLPHNLLKNLIEAKNLTENRINHIVEVSGITLNEDMLKKIICVISDQIDDSILEVIDWYPDHKDDLSYDESHVYLLLKYFLRKTSIKYSVTARLIADKKDLLNAILKKSSRIDSGWRFEVFGKFAKSLLDGEKTIKIKNGSLLSVV